MSLLRASSEPRRHLRLVRAGSDDPEEARLLGALVRGEAWAATTAWNLYAPMVFRLFSRALGPTSDCEDLTQEVFVAVFASARRVRDPDAFRSFVYSCAVRRLRTHLRRHRLRTLFPLFSPEQLPERIVPEADLHGRQVLTRFYRTLDRLAVEDRTAYTLRYLEGLRLEEIRVVTGVSLATVKRRIARGVAAVASHARRDPLLAEYVVAEDSDDP